MSEGAEVNGSKSSVVGNLEGTSNCLQLGDGDVDKVWVCDDSESTSSATSVADSGQVWRSEGGEVVLVESQRSVDGSQGRNADSGNVSQGHVGSPDQVGEGDLQQLSIGINVDRIRDIANLSAELGQSEVVVDVQGLGSHQVDAIKTAQEGVGDENICGGGNDSGQSQGRQSLQRVPRDVVDRGERGEREGRHQSQVEQVHSSADRAQGRTAQACQGTCIVADQVTSDLFGAVQVDDTSSIRANEDVSGDGRAGGVLCGIGLGVDGGSGLRADGSLGCRSVSSVSVHVN